MAENPNSLLPVGTRVVVREDVVENGAIQHPVGAVGVVTASPLDATHAYRIRFPGGVTVSLRRRAFSLLSEVKDERAAVPLHPLEERDLHAYVIYRCVVGSRAYGLETEASDTDRRGIYLPPARLHWSLAGVPEQLEDPATQECYWELQKFLLLALKSNPNVLECLWTPLVEHADDTARELLALRRCFLSRLVYQTYNGYALSQFRKMEAEASTGEFRRKPAMHLLRLLLAGITILQEGEVVVRVSEERDRLLAVRDGRMTWAEVDLWRRDLHRRFDEAVATSPLPDRPDYARVETFLLAARRRALDL